MQHHLCTLFFHTGLMHFVGIVPRCAAPGRAVYHIQDYMPYARTANTAITKEPHTITTSYTAKEVLQF